MWYASELLFRFDYAKKKKDHKTLIRADPRINCNQPVLKPMENLLEKISNN